MTEEERERILDLREEQLIQSKFFERINAAHKGHSLAKGSTEICPECQELDQQLTTDLGFDWMPIAEME